MECDYSINFGNLAANFGILAAYEEILVFCYCTYKRTSGFRRIEKSESHEMEEETFYFLVSFWFDGKIVIKGKTSDICVGEKIPYTYASKFNL